MAANGALNGTVPVTWMAKLRDLPTPPDIMSARTKGLLGKALTQPTTLTPQEIQELAASVVFHLVKVREEERAEQPQIDSR